jgi:hypothetical protein
MDQGLVEQVREIQQSMSGAAGECLSRAELEHLSVLIRLAVEFHSYLQDASVDQLEPNRVRYRNESILSGVDSFCSVSAAYRVLVGSRETTLDWRAVSLFLLREQFMAVYDKFASATEFEPKCRLLLDLFKLQIVFAGMTYE